MRSIRQNTPSWTSGVTSSDPWSSGRTMTSSSGWNVPRLTPDLYEEIVSFAEKKNRDVVRDDEEEWREAIRRETEAEIERRVREALETPPGERIKKQRQGGKHGNHRNLQELENLNSHVHLDLTVKEHEHIRRQRWKAKRRVNIPYDTEYGYTHRNSAESAPSQFYSKHGYDFDPLDGTYVRRHSSSLLDDIYTPRDLKTEDYYAQVTNKALSNFSGLSDAEKHEFYYAFTRSGFKDALRTGKLPDGSKLTDLGNGKFTDRFGIVRDCHGPFWPLDYGPLYPTPQHKRIQHKKPELLNTVNQDIFIEKKKSNLG